jgi:hypothetical protein
MWHLNGRGRTNSGEDPVKAKVGELPKGELRKHVFYALGA